MENRLVSTSRRRALSERNKTWVMMICYPLSLLMIILPLHFLLLAIEAVALLAIGTSLGKLKAIYLTLPVKLSSGFTYVIATRKRIQANRRLGNMEYLRQFRLLPWKFVMLLRHGMPKLH